MQLLWYSDLWQWVTISTDLLGVDFNYEWDKQFTCPEAFFKSMIASFIGLLSCFTALSWYPMSLNSKGSNHVRLQHQETRKKIRVIDSGMSFLWQLLCTFPSQTKNSWDKNCCQKPIASCPGKVFVSANIRYFSVNREAKKQKWQTQVLKRLGWFSVLEF